VRYRVRRGQDRAPVSAAEGTAVAAQTGRNDVTDTEPPLGADLIYSVFADRGGEACSPPAVTQSVVFAPDVTGISVTAADTSVAVSWRAHPGADAVLVVRGEGRPPRGTDDGTAVEASLAGFTDAGLRTGTEYFYRIAASYRAPGGQRRTVGRDRGAGGARAAAGGGHRPGRGRAGRRHAPGRGQLDAPAAWPGAAGDER
jgi:hypothetical protein